MLTQKRQRLGFYSFIIDIGFGVLILFLTFAFLQLYTDTWEYILQTITRYPFEIDSVIHLQGDSWLFVIILTLVFLSLQVSGFYRFDHHSRFLEVTLVGIKGIIMGLALIALCIYFLNLTRVNRSFIFLFIFLFAGYLFLKTLVWFRFLRYRERKGHPLEVIFVGSIHSITKTLAELKGKMTYGLHIKGIILLEDTINEIEGFKVLGNWNDLSKILTREPLDAVCFFPSSTNDRTPELLHAIEETGIELWYFLPEMFSKVATPRQDYFFEHPLLLVSSTRHYDGFFGLKRLFDICVSALLLVLFLPIFALLVVVVKATSPGPIFFKQVRTGFKGRPFQIYKFRTMQVVGAENYKPAENTINGPVYKADEDPRITPVGKWLRRYSLDELPQFWNVFKGDMSMVGPRPLPVEETRAFEAFRDHRRYRVLPGITGLWQVSGRASILDFEEWIRLDLYYIDNWSFALDLKILLKTIPAVFSGKGAK